MTAVLFKNGALLDPTQRELREGYHVLVENGRIKEVSDRPLQSADARTIDLAGKTIMPGLIDLHGHAMASLNLSPQGLAAGRVGHAAFVPIMEGMLRRGFTTLRDAGGAGWGLKRAVEDGSVGDHACSSPGAH